MTEVEGNWARTLRADWEHNISFGSYVRERSWRERLTAWPWRPWQKYEWVTIVQSYGSFDA